MLSVIYSADMALFTFRLDNTCPCAVSNSPLVKQRIFYKFKKGVYRHIVSVGCYICRRFIITCKVQQRTGDFQMRKLARPSSAVAYFRTLDSKNSSYYPKIYAHSFRCMFNSQRPLKISEKLTETVT